jgi:hypothetical protein
VLLARLGLRAAEIAVLRLDDIEWRAGEIIVRGKGGTEERLPCPALVRRSPTTCGTADPGAPSGRCSCARRPRFAGWAPRGSARQSGQPANGPGSEASARTASGTQREPSLRAGASLPEVAQVLRHRSVATTCIYALKGGPSGAAPAGDAVARGRDMTGFAAAAAGYLATRRAMGYMLVWQGQMLRQFAAYLDSAGAQHLTVDHALSWARQPAGAAPTWWAVRLGTGRSFARYLSTLDPATENPPAGLLPEPSHRIVPHIYFDQDVAVRQAAGRLCPQHRADTYQTLIGLLALTGRRLASRSASIAVTPTSMRAC